MHIIRRYIRKSSGFPSIDQLTKKSPSPIYGRRGYHNTGFLTRIRYQEMEQNRLKDSSSQDSREVALNRTDWLDIVILHQDVEHCRGDEGREAWSKANSLDAQ